MTPLSRLFIVLFEYPESDQSNIDSANGVSLGRDYLGFFYQWQPVHVRENLCEYSAVSEGAFRLRHFQLKNVVCFGRSFTKQTSFWGSENANFWKHSGFKVELFD